MRDRSRALFRRCGLAILLAAVGLAAVALGARALSALARWGSYC